MLPRPFPHVLGAKRLSSALLPLLMIAPLSASGVVALSGTGHSRTGSADTWMSTPVATGTPTTLKDIRRIIGADQGAAAALSGAGVGVALLDTGVAPVAGLPAAQIVNGPDLSFESQTSDLRYLDTYGHGTHLAGIIIGNDTTTSTVGIAPKSKLTSIKLGTGNGAVDVSQVIAGLDWVVQHRSDDAANPIRVIALAYGSAGKPTRLTDPLQFAVERAWKAGIVVVVAAGNDGNSTTTLTNPAADPFVLAVGAADTNGTLSTSDDTLSAYTNLTAGHRQPDVLAPGQSVVSLRDPGSMIDNTFPAARTGTTLFRGSGTSQATAVTAAAVALLLQSRPTLTPDQVKDIMERGTAITSGLGATQNLHELNLSTALALAPHSTAAQTSELASGTGGLDGARGSSRVVVNGIELTGDRTVLGSFSGSTHATAALAGTAWKGGLWLGVRMAGDGWTGTSFASKTWSAATWPGSPWGGPTSWQDPSWQGRFWAGRFWAATNWSGRFWASEDWSTAAWK
ncbi:MAG: serine protease AprX [Actinoplanes sp.]|nr:serine protease AprX [Actinoplanes sp.]